MKRSQTFLFPKSIDEYIDEENEVRFIDAFVDGLDLGSLGFSHCDDVETGRHHTIRVTCSGYTSTAILTT